MIDQGPIMMRQCGDCQLCCKLLPVPAVTKKANEKCQFQKFKVGCTLYHKPAFPVSCAFWNCRWLVNNDTADLPRPDRSHYVIDIVPDIISAKNDDTGESYQWECVQVWCSPSHKDAWRTPEMQAYIYRRAAENVVTLIRYDARKSIVVFAPPISPEWYERPGTGTPGVGLFG